MYCRGLSQRSLLGHNQLQPGDTIKIMLLVLLAIIFVPVAAKAQNTGDIMNYVPNPTINPYAGGTIFQQNGINNPYESYGSSNTSDSFNNPSTTEVPKLFDEYGNYRGP
ncbi:MAG: hypothetical protein FJX39_04315 [Alphaproteobacteria bacterium]|nr:hypothetical protein [Alphaproteobacteria bacterium]